MVSFRTLCNQKRLTERVGRRWRSIFFVMLALNVLQKLQRNVDRFVCHCDSKRQQGQNFQQSHWASPLCCAQAPGRFAFSKKFLSRLRLFHSIGTIHTSRVRKHDHLQCRQHLIHRLFRRYFYCSIKFDRLQHRKPPAARGAAGGFWFYAGIKHKTIKRRIA